jgi:hypothetical protein
MRCVVSIGNRYCIQICRLEIEGHNEKKGVQWLEIDIESKFADQPVTRYEWKNEV